MRRALLTLALCLCGLTAVFAQLDIRRVTDIGRNALFFNDYVVAIGYFNRVIEARPEQAEPYLLRGYAKLMLDDLAGAEADASKALSRNAFLTRAYLIRAIARQGRSEYEKALADYRTALAVMPDDAAIRFNMALSYRAIEQYASADSLAGTLSQSFKSYPLSLALRGDIALARKDTTQAITYIDSAIKASDSTLYQAFVMKGAVLAARERYKEAIGYYDCAERNAPDKEDIYINRGLARYRVGNLSGALEDYNRAIDLAPDNVTARFNRAQLLGYVGDNNNALSDFKEVIKADPNNYMALFNAGRISLQLGKYADALGYFNKVLERYPRFQVGLLARAEAKRRMGDRAGADRDEWRAYNQQKRGAVASKQPTSATPQADSTRSEEESAIEAYGKLLAATGSSDLSRRGTLPESLRGRVQDTEGIITSMPMITFTFYPNVKQYDRQRYISVVAAYNERTKPIRRLAAMALPMPLDSAEVADAQQQLTELEAHPKKTADAHFTIALYKFLLADVEGAAAHLDRAVELDPAHLPVRMLRAFTSLRRASLGSNKLGSVEKEENSPMSAVTGYNESGYAAKAYESAYKDLKFVLEQDPHMAVALYNMAVLSERKGQKEEALAYYQAALAAPHAPAEAYYNMGLLLLSTGKRAEAVAALSKAGELGLYEAYAILKRIQ